MKNSFYYYNKQNEYCLKLVLLPFILIMYAIKKLLQIKKQRYTTQKR